MRRPTLFVAAALALALPAHAGLFQSDSVVKEDVAVPRTWIRRAVANESETIPLHIAVKSASPGSIESALDKTSDPDHEKYLQHLSRQDVVDLLRPSKDSSDAVDKWLAGHAISKTQTKRSASGDWVTIEVPVLQARSMLQADFSVFEHRDTGERVVRTTKYSLPRSVSDHVDFVGGTTYFSTMRSLKAPYKIVDKVSEEEVVKLNMASAATAADGVPASCNASAVTSLCLRELYGTHEYKPRAPRKTHIGIAGFLGEHANREDLRLFLAKERPDAFRGDATFDYVTLNGEHNNQTLSGSTGEAALDIQTVVGVTYPIRTSFYSVGGSPPIHPDVATPTNTNEPYAELFEYLIHLPDGQLPDVLTISYGDDEQTVPMAYARRVCTLVAALGLRGVSVFDSSGDDGVGSSAEGACATNDRKKTKTFLPAFPSTCPYITSVGAVKDFGPEKVTTRKFSFIVSGGGFSNYFPRPAYQNTSVPHYLQKYQGNKDHGLFNPHGRAYPDVSAQGSRFVISVGGRFVLISGTSASTPLFASVVSLLNDARIAENKATLGFVNPLVYKRLGNTKAFNDVTIGSATGCGGMTGFAAEPGWDPVTGFGTPNFKTMLAQVRHI